MGGGLTWDAVTLMSIAMVAISILIIVYLVYKVITLMNRDAEAHKNSER
jgi:heme/copper-type cytochrome/quinol oxidase subunit 2